MNQFDDRLFAPKIQTSFLECIAKSIGIKRDFITTIDPKEYIYSRVKGAITEDLRKLHDTGIHLCSKKLLELASLENVLVDFSVLKNSKQSRLLLGEGNPLQFEHVFPVRQTILIILKTSPGTCLKSIIQETSCTAWILKSEDEKIREKSLRASPKTTYQSAGIELLQKVGERWTEFDWSKIELWAEKSVH